MDETKQIFASVARDEKSSSVSPRFGTFAVLNEQDGAVANRGLRDEHRTDLRGRASPSKIEH